MVSRLPKKIARSAKDKALKPGNDLSGRHPKLDNHSSAVSYNNVDGPFGNFLLERKELEEHLAWADRLPRKVGMLQYSSRLSFEAIRLVILYPGDHGNDISLRTDVRSVEEAANGYFALSYVWGDQRDTLPIIVDGYEFQATRNLVAALGYIRRMLQDDQTMCLWIDAICINQKDVQERNAQVAMMRRIYERAALVITWLGAEHSEGLEYLDELGKWVFGRDEDPQSVTRKRDRIEPATHVKDRMQQLRAVAGVVGNRYWQRAWTVQEYSSPSPGLFLCGNVWMDRLLLHDALQMYIQALRFLQIVLEDKGRDAVFIDVTIQGVHRLIHDQKLSYARASSFSDDIDRFDFLAMLLRFCNLDATDSRDKVYAPLNLAAPSNATKAIGVDYSLSVSDLYVKVAVQCLQKEEWPLCVLELCRLGLSPDLPTWVPDWRILPRRVGSKDGTTGRQILAAGKGIFPASTLPPTVVLSGNRLQLRGILVDSVAEVWPAWDAKLLRGATEVSIEAQDALEEYVITGEPMCHVYRACVHDDEPTRGSDEIVVDGRVVLATKAEWRMESNILARINRRRLGRTANGLVGLLPAEAEVGDVVWLLRGGNVFHVLRHRQGKDEKDLVGEAYLHGLMHGELCGQASIMSTLSSEESIVLR